MRHPVAPTITEAFQSSWLVAASLRTGNRAAAIMTLLHTARINAHEPYTYLKNVLERLPTLPTLPTLPALPALPASRINELLPHRWSPSA